MESLRAAIGNIDIFQEINVELQLAQRELQRIAEARRQLESEELQAKRRWERAVALVNHAVEQLKNGEVPQRPIWKGAKQILTEANRPLPVPEILARLQAQGWRIPSPNGREIVRSALLRRGEVFTRCADGRFVLAQVANGPRMKNERAGTMSP